MLAAEFRYLQIVWQDPHTATKLETSQQAIECELSDGVWKVETTTFPATHHYIGVRITDELLHPPYFLLANGAHEELMPIKTPGSEQVWWVQRGVWNREKWRYDTELFRTSGRVELMLQRQRCLLENNCANFSVAELEHYLADFKNDLWMLILDNSSVAQGGVLKQTSHLFDHDAISLFDEFTRSVENIIKSPNMLLSETLGKVPRRAVKPVLRTFRELVIRHNAKQLTSRTFFESYDTAENRYIHYAVQRGLFLLKSFERISELQRVSIGRKLAQEQAALRAAEQCTTKQVDAVVYEHEIAELTAQLQVFTETIPAMLVGKGNPSVAHDVIAGVYSFQLGPLYGRTHNCCFIRAINEQPVREQYPGTYLVLKLPSEVDFSTLATSLSLWEIKISGQFLWREEKGKKGKIYYVFTCLSIASCQAGNFKIASELARLQHERSTYERNNWIAPLTRDELEERNVEKEVSSKKIEFYTHTLHDLSQFAAPAAQILSRLAALAKFFKANRVKSQSHCPNSMVFIQNPAYVGAKNFFKKITNINGLDDGLLKSLVLVDDIGLVNISLLYEKWILLKIVGVLRRVYGFSMQEGWQSGLITAALKNHNDIAIYFDAPERQQTIVLTYQKLLASGKKPDFVLDLYFNQYDVDWQQSVWVVTDRPSKRLVLDAKFRGNVSESHIKALVNELYVDKDYSEQGRNAVFVVHPSPDVIVNRTSPLPWGRQCDYGQSNGVKHRCGSIFVSPSLTHDRSVDNLQRLIGGFLQWHNVLLQHPFKNETVWHNQICIGCGNDSHETLNIVCGKTEAGSKRWVISCQSCGLRTIQTVCVSCHGTLFKNGYKWTYHQTRAEQTSNIVCPACEKYL